jgi:hypothetical protein
MKELIMKKTIIAGLVAVSALGLSGTSFAGNGSYVGDSIPTTNEIEATITRSMTFSPSDVTTTTNTATNNITVGDIVAAVSVATAPAYAAGGDLAVATATADQASSFPLLDTVVTPVVGLSAALGSSGAGTDGLVMGNVDVSGAVGSGVGANIGGAVFESINTATAIAINGGMSSVTP